MPTYQYRCTDCGHDLEAVQKFSDAALTECPACGGSLRKVFNAVGVVFKGSGFYRTDSRASNGNGDGGSGSKDKSEGKDSAAPKEKKDAKEPAAAKATNGSGGTKQPAASGTSSTGGSSST
jgi:putative FmdB family regulatory protein